MPDNVRWWHDVPPGDDILSKLRIDLFLISRPEPREKRQPIQRTQPHLESQFNRSEDSPTAQVFYSHLAGIGCLYASVMCLCARARARVCVCACVRACVRVCWVGRGHRLRATPKLQICTPDPIESRHTHRLSTTGRKSHLALNRVPFEYYWFHLRYSELQHSVIHCSKVAT